MATCMPRHTLAVTHSVFLLPSVANDYGLFLSDEDPKKGIWLEAGKALDYYMLRNGVSHHYTNNYLSVSQSVMDS